MEDSLSLIDVRMYLPFNYRLEILLHFTAGNLDDNGERHPAALLIFFLPVIRLNNNFIVLYLIQFNHFHPFEGRRLLTAEFSKGIFLSDSLTLKCRAICDRNRRFFNRNLKTSHFYGLLHYLGMVKFLVNMLIGAYTRWQYHRDICITNSREAHVNCPSSSCPFYVVHWTKGDRKGKDPVFLV